MQKKTFNILLIILLILITFVICFLFNIRYTVDRKGFFDLQKNKCSIFKNDVNIAMITDEHYIYPTATSIYSAIQNKCKNSIYTFYIIADNISIDSQNYLYKLSEYSPDTVNIEVINVEDPKLDFENIESKISHLKSGMHKLFLSDILSKLDKVIYVDGDTIILKDLSYLYNKNVSNVYAHVVKDTMYYLDLAKMRQLGVSDRGFYFNSGVMLLNLEKQRSDDVIPKFVDYVAKNKNFFGDQDVLNVIFGDKLKLMSYRYNCIHTFFEIESLDFLSKYYEEKLPDDYETIYENATIIHYAGIKPWGETYSQPLLKKIWLKYYNELRGL